MESEPELPKKFKKDSEINVTQSVVYYAEELASDKGRVKNTSHEKLEEIIKACSFKSTHRKDEIVDIFKLNKRSYESYIEGTRRNMKQKVDNTKNTAKKCVMACCHQEVGTRIDTNALNF